MATVFQMINTNTSLTLPDRQSIRLKGWDYSSLKCFLVAFYVQDICPVFWTIVKENRDTGVDFTLKS
jgi:hypothetical protein